jgi:sugar phosphate isomerase/epimerase
MQLGLSSFTFGWAVGVPGHPPANPLDEPGLLDRCRAEQIHLLQIGDNLPLHTFESSRLQALAQRAAREQVQLEVGARGLTPERITQYTAIARQLGARLIRFVIDDAGYQPPPETITSILRDAGPLLDGLQLGLENHDRFPAAGLRRLVESTGDPRIGVCLDTANSLGAGEGLGEVAATLAPVTLNLHVKDFQIERVSSLMGFTVRGCAAGSGLLDLPGLLAQLAPFGKCQTAVLELWTPYQASVESTINLEADWARESIAYLKPLFV